MSKIFELYGFRLDCWNEAADENRSRAWCPFMGAECDGGGNRYLSALQIDRTSPLHRYFPGKTHVQAGVCSLRLKENEQPWIVCPRRLLTLVSSASSVYQGFVREQVVKRAQLVRGPEYRVWSEVKIKVDTKGKEGEAKSFDYTFDYVIAGSGRRRLEEVGSIVGLQESTTRKLVEDKGFTVARRNGILWVDDFPADPVVIIEIMTSSTSGGNKRERTQIAMACQDAIIDRQDHNGPGINYRQVWARMVSQLIVKSQVGLAWGGKTIWLLQDVLAQYISNTTALDLKHYLSEVPGEVNILSLGYGDLDEESSQPIAALGESAFYAGPIGEGGSKRPSRGFVEIVKMGSPPGKEHLWRSLVKKRPCSRLPADAWPR